MSNTVPDTSPRRERRTRPRPTDVAVSDAGRWLIAADLLAIAGGSLLVAALARPLGLDQQVQGSARQSHLLLFAMFDLLLVIRLGMSGQYEARQRFDRIDDLIVLLRCTFTAAAIAVFLSVLSKGFFLEFTDYSRWFVAVGIGVPTVLLLATRQIGLSQQRRAFKKGSCVTYSLVVGGGQRAREFSEWLREQPSLGVGSHLSECAPSDDIEAFRTGIRQELMDHRPNEVVIAFEHAHPDARDAIVTEAALLGIAVKVLPGVFESYRSTVLGYGGRPVTTLFETPEQRFARRLKFVFDACVAAVALLMLLPLFLIVAPLIKLSDGGPVFYRQWRVGQYGRRFRFWKFRTMRVDADEVLERYLSDHPEARNEWDKFQKLSNDPRITRIGKLLRRTSLDELPQLINVLVGEMSLVGPRPPMPGQVTGYGDKFVFNQARPGLTGLWQVSGRNEIDFDGRVDLDAWYLENWSLGLDLRIAVRTVLVVITGRGAY